MIIQTMLSITHMNKPDSTMAILKPYYISGVEEKSN